MQLQTEYRLGWLLLLLVLLAGVGLRWPWPADEPRFALIAQEMVQTGQWLLPHRVGELYPDKPPLFMWAIALFLLLKVPLKIAFLLPSLLAGLGTAALLTDLSRRLFGREAAVRTLWLLAFTLQFTLQAKTAQIDMLLCFWVTLSGYGLLRHLLLGPAWRWYFIAFAAAGFGVITKGVGFLALFMLLPLLWRGDLRARLDRRAWLGPVVMLAAMATWGLPMLSYILYSADPEALAYRDNILFRQTVDRYVHALGHRKGWWYYLVNVIPLFWLPLSLLAPFLMPAWWREKQRLEILLPAVMIVSVIVFFSLSPGKRGVYVTPAVPWLALISAPFLLQALARPWCERSVTGLLWLVAIGLLIAGALPRLHEVAGLMGVVFVLATGLAMVAALWLGRRSPAWRRWGYAASALWLGYSTLGVTAFEPTRTPIDVMAAVAQRMPADGRLAIVKFKEQMALFADRPVVQFGFHTPADIQRAGARDWVRRAQPPHYVLGPEPDLESCFELGQGTYVNDRHRTSWHLVTLVHLKPECAAGLDAGQLYQGPFYGQAPDT